MSDKVSSLWSKTKTEAARAKQKVLEKMGKAEETVDISFIQEKERFLTHYKACKKLQKDTIKLLETVRDLSVCQTTLAEGFYNIYDTSCQFYNTGLKTQDIAKQIDVARTQMDEQIRVDLLDPLNKYLGQFKELKNRLQELEVRRVDMDRYSRDVRIYAEKGNSGKHTLTNSKLEAARSNYTNLNDELMRDMPALYADRVKFFDPGLSTYLSASAEYYRQSSKAAADALPLISAVNRQATREHPRCITSAELSYATNKQNNAPNNGVPSPQQFNKPETEEVTSAVVPSAKPPPPRPKTTEIKIQVRALYDFNAQDATELTFKTGEIITILKNNGEWWEGELRGQKGLLPSNYVEMIK